MPLLRDAIDATGRAKDRVDLQQARVSRRVDSWKRQADTELALINQKAVAADLVLKTQAANLADRARSRLARVRATLDAALRPVDDLRRRLD